MSDELNTIIPPTPALSALFKTLGKNLIFRGILEVLLGVLLLINPLQTTMVLTIVVGAFLAADGFGLLIAGIRHAGSGKTLLIVNASALLLLGVITVFRPILVDTMWVFIIGVWQIFGGVECFTNGGWRRAWGVVSGVLSLILGVVFIIAPFVGLLSMIWVLGVMLVFSGALTIAAGGNLRSAGKR